MRQKKKFLKYQTWLFIAVIIIPSVTYAASMTDYCASPPFISGKIPANLLLYVDNSASAYDLAWTDTANRYCGNATTLLCNNQSNPNAYCAGLNASTYPATCTGSYTTTNVPGASVPLFCTNDADCALCPANCIAPECTCTLLSGDSCFLSGNRANQCKKSTMNSAATTRQGTISCTSDADCRPPASGGTAVCSCGANCTCTWVESPQLDTCNNKCSVIHSCYDDTYSSTTKYTGYFDSSATYSYNNNMFTSGATMPGSCDYSASDSSGATYVCVSVNATPVVTSFVAKGNFLNWLTASKFDLEKQIFTGGKYDAITDAANPGLIAETRGCSGRKFIKVVPSGTMTGITFALRGGKLTGSNNITTQATEWGQTYIEIYGGTYNAAACMAAVNDWLNVNTVNLGTLQGDSNCCIAGCPGGICKTSGCNPTADQLIVNSQIIHDCYWYYTGHGLTNTQPIENACVKDWSTNSHTSITNPSAPDAICSGVLDHTNSLVWNPAAPGYTKGYLGLCFNFTNGTWDETCVLNEQKDFCQGMGSGATVTDPGTSNTITGTLQNVPGFVVENGLAALPPIGELTVKVSLASPPTANALINKYANSIRFGVLAFNNNGSSSECNTNGWCSITTAHSCTADTDCSGLTPSGQKCVFSIPCASTCSGNGARQCFNDCDCHDCSGAGLFPDYGTCIPLTKTDGGKILSYIGDPVGDHNSYCSVTTTQKCNTDAGGTVGCPAGETCVSSGVIRSIDNIQATSWTPFAEAFYTAIGYYAPVQVCSNNTAQLCTSDSDCSGALCAPKKVCTNDTSLTCSQDTDCTPGTCGRLSRDFRLQTGNCSGTTTKTCNPARADCPVGETCEVAGTKGDYNLGRNPSQFRCQNNNILLITDGMSTADRNLAIDGAAGLATIYASQVPNTIGGTTMMGLSGPDTANNCPPYLGSRSISDLSYLAQNWNIKNFSTSAQTPKTCSASGSSCKVNSDCSSPSGQTCINAPQQASDSIKTYVVYSGTQTGTQPGLCDPYTLMSNTATNGGTSLISVSNPQDLYNKLDQALAAVSGRAASGTAASVLASGEGSGANLVQAIFYPSREFGANKVDWTGKLQNFWYYIDPRLGNSTILEDTNMDKALNLLQDNAVAFVYDESTHQTTVTTRSPGGVVTPKVSLDDVHFLWEAGNLLFDRTAASRTIYTPCSINSSACLMSGSNSTGLMTFSTGNLDGSTQQPYLQAAGSTEADNIVNYVRGAVISGFRNRTANRCSSTPRACSTSADCPSGDTCTSTGVLKLGDIVNSTPKILSWVPINTYYELYNDATYKAFTSSGHCSTTTTQLCQCSGGGYPCSSGMTPACPGGETCVSGYKSRGLVFAGGNDGMLHAFKLGLLGLYNDTNLKATLGKHCSTDASKACNTDSDCAGTCTTDTDLGQEMWAFIPKHSLPYLKYFADPNYCHIYYIDAQPFIFDASIAVPSGCSETDYWKCSKPTDGSSWRTVLIGSMRLGGACKNSGDTCQDCTKAPISNVGYSSYFALDITDPLTPQLLWEFSNPALGFSTSGPAIVRVGTDNSDPGNPILIDRNHNGRWFAVFGSGPTGWISQNNNMAISSMYLSNVGQWNAQPNTMKLFVVDVATGSLVTTIDTGEQGAFAGSLLNATMDFDQGDLSKAGNYQDDAVYFGYTKGYVYGVDSTITQGDARGGTANTMILAASSSTTNDFYKGKFIEMWKQDAASVWHYEGAKLITGYNGATQTATVDSDFPVAPTTGAPWTFYNISNGWTRGGVKRLLTNQDIDPTHWAVSTVIDSSSLFGNTSHNTRLGGAGMGPVTASVKKLQNFSDNTVRLYFGTGRYFYRLSDLLDDPSNLRALYSVVEPCFQSDGTVNTACTTRTSGNIAGGVTVASGLQVSNIGEAANSAGIDLAANPSLKGWWITLDGCRDSNLTSVDCVTVSGVANPAAVFKAERVVTEPLAATSGAIFFSTITPTSDPCEYGGRSYLWAVRFDTGGTLVPFGILKGKAIIQRSTGEIEQIDLSTAFRADHGGLAGERKTTASFGLTGSGGISIVVPPKPLNQILHIKKR